MNKDQAVGIGALVVAASVTVAATVGTVLVMRSPHEVRHDATLMRPEVTITRLRNKLQVHGAFRVLRPVNSGRDHAVVIRLTVSQPGEGGLLVHEEDLAKINYHRNHKSDVAYPIDKEIDMDVTGLDVKVVAVEGKHEFASVIDHGGK